MKASSLFPAILLVWLVACSAPLPKAVNTPPTETQKPEPVSLTTAIQQAAAASAASVQGQAISKALPELKWDQAADVLLLSASTCCGMASKTMRLNYIPSAQIWGDGRILWAQYDETGARQVFEGKLDAGQIESLLQTASQDGFFSWSDLYKPTNPPTDMPLKCIEIHLQSESKKVCEYFQGAPQAFHQLYKTVAEGAGASGSAFIPQRAFLVARRSDKAIQPSDRKMMDLKPDVLGLSLAQMEQGGWIEGASLAELWTAINANPSSATVLQGGDLYQLTMQIPGISFIQP